MPTFKIKAQKRSTVDESIVGGDEVEVIARDEEGARDAFFAEHQVMSGLAEWEITEVNRL